MAEDLKGVTKEAYDRHVIPKGTVIVCPNDKCRQFIAITQKAIGHGTKLTSDLFKGPHIHPGCDNHCPKCNMRWYLEEIGRFSTHKGWQPNPNKIEFVEKLGEVGKAKAKG